MIKVLHISETKIIRACISLLYLMHAITCPHASTQVTNLRHVKNGTRHFRLMTRTVWSNEMKKRKKKAIKFNSWSFFPNFVNLFLAWMLYFHVWVQNMGKCLVWFEYYNEFYIYHTSCVSLLEPQQNSLSNLEAYAEAWQTYFFAKIVLKAVSFSDGVS